MTIVVSLSSSTTQQVSEDPDPSPSPTSGKFVSCYENVGVMTGTITATDDIDNLPQNIQLINYTCNVKGFSAVQLDEYTIRITGTATGVFPGGYYKFLMPDGSILESYDVPQNYSALISWTPVNNKVYNATHNIVFGVASTSQTISYTVSQEIYWKYQLAISQFRQVLAGGKL